MDWTGITGQDKPADLPVLVTEVGVVGDSRGSSESEEDGAEACEFVDNGSSLTTALGAWNAGDD